MACSPNKLIQRLADMMNNEFSKSDFTNYFFRSDYGYERIDYHWRQMITRGLIVKSVEVRADGHTVQRENSRHEALFSYIGANNAL